MARRTKRVTISDPNSRDNGKVYQLTEMPASQAEKWAARAFLAMAHAGIEVPEELQGTGMAAIAVLGLRVLGHVNFAEAEPLLDEMMGCVLPVPDPQKQPNYVRDHLVEDDIEEMSTRLILRREVFELHTGFSLAGLISTWSARQVPEVETSNSSSTSTSPELLQQ